MIVFRDFLTTLQAKSSLEAVLVWGPRQVGKTTLLNQLPLKTKLYLDDLSLRQRAQTDPALALNDLSPPCLIDEVQYAPALFPELKLRIDALRRETLATGHTFSTLYFLTGSNRTLLDKNVKESLAGRCHIFTLLGFSVREVLTAFPKLSIKTILLKGGFPELYTRSSLAPKTYLDDYIISFIEKDIAHSAGIEKLGEFQTVLRLLAARTGQFIQVSEIAGAAGVDQKTVISWIHLLQRNFILDLVLPYSSNLSKRITKMKKLFFLDTGLCARLQSHSDENLLWNSAQAGSLFESLVFSELKKIQLNFLKDWQVYTWRTKEKHEIDFVIETNDQFLFIESKLGIHGAKPFSLDSEAQKVFSTKPYQKIVVTVGGHQNKLTRDTLQVPIHNLCDFLK